MIRCQEMFFLGFWNCVIQQHSHLQRMCTSKCSLLATLYTFLPFFFRQCLSTLIVTMELSHLVSVFKISEITETFVPTDRRALTPPIYVGTNCSIIPRPPTCRIAVRNIKAHRSRAAVNEPRYSIEKQVARVASFLLNWGAT